MKHILLLLIFPALLFSQGSKSDYERAFSWRNNMRSKLTRHTIDTRWSPDQNFLIYKTRINDKAQATYRVNLTTGKKEITQKLEGEKSNRSKHSRQQGKGGPRSPDGQWEVQIRNHNVYLKGHDAALSTDGHAEHAYHGGGNIFWSPDSSHFVVLQVTKGDERKVTYVESAPRDQLQPKVHSYHYLKPGDRVAIRKPRLFRVSDKKQIPIDDALFKNPWRTESFRWLSDSSKFTFLFNQRGHQALRIIAVDRTGAVQTLVNEESDTFIDYAFKTWFHWLDDSKELLWMSERDGWNHLYMVDTSSGKIKSQITSGPWMVRRVLEVDEVNRHLYITACGLHQGEDPYQEHYVRVSFDASEFTVLTKADAMHEIEVSPDGKYFIDRYSRPDLPPVHELRRRGDGALIAKLEKADTQSLYAAGFPTPERFKAKGRDGKTDIYGLIFRPSNFDPDRKYPVIEYIYAGPHDYHVPKKFYSAWVPQPVAELGFVVVQIDGMGTNWRGKKFHDVAWRNLKDAGFPDRKAWLRAAAKERPYMDLSRVGIFGGSAGGQNAMAALLWHNDFYHAAAADCGCHDNRMDKIWWNEAWMGWPIGKHYSENSNVDNAHRLKGHLFLTVGEKDSNVDPASTMQVVDALIKANKDFDMLVLPGKGHGAGNSAYATRRMYDFFVRHLWGIEPRKH